MMFQGMFSVALAYILIVSLPMTTTERTFAVIENGGAFYYMNEAAEVSLCCLFILGPRCTVSNCFGQ